MTLPEDRQYSLEDIIAEFKSDPDTVPGQKRETQPSLAAELAHLDESLWSEPEDVPASVPHKQSAEAPAVRPEEAEPLPAEEPETVARDEKADLHTLNMQVKTAAGEKAVRAPEAPAFSDEKKRTAKEKNSFSRTCLMRSRRRERKNR